MSAPVVVPRERALPGSPLAKAQAGIDACVHCGFCLQACPTYLTLEDENDSPRGRIVLMRSLLEGTLTPANESVETHIARCLGCRACETVCPSGVPYGHLLEATRATLARHRPIPWIARVILGVFSRQSLLSLAMRGGRVMRATGLARLMSRLPGRVGFAMAMLASTDRESSEHDARYPARGNGMRGNVALLERMGRDLGFDVVGLDLVRADGGPGIGMGHVMRSLAIAQAWRRHRAPCAWACVPLSDQRRLISTACLDGNRQKEAADKSVWPAPKRSAAFLLHNPDGDKATHWRRQGRLPVSSRHAQFNS